MDISRIASNVVKTVKSNSPEILTALAITGVATTAYLTAKAAYVASEVIHSNEDVSGTPADRKERFKERARHTWRLYIPAVISGGFTIGCVIGSSKLSKTRTAAAVTAYSLTERAFSEYKEKVVEQLGATKEQKVRDEIAADKVKSDSPTSKEVIITGKGEVLCCELYTRRYFRSDMETLRKAQNDINFKLNHEYYVPLDDFYELVGLPFTSNSPNLGWESDAGLMELQFSTVLSEDGNPCLAFDYTYVKPIR